MYGVMPPTRRNLSIAIPSGFAVAVCVGAGANKMISLSSIPASAAVDAGCYPASRESGLAEFSAGKSAGVLDSAAQRVTGTACGECEAVALIGGAQSTETTLPVPARAGAGDSGSPTAEAVGLLSVGAGDQRQAGVDSRATPTRSAESLVNAGAASAKTGGPDRLLSAIEWVESRCNPSAVGDGGRAVGVLQVWPITVADANRILGREEFSLADRLDPDRRPGTKAIDWAVDNFKSKEEAVADAQTNGGVVFYLPGSDEVQP